MTMNTTFLLPSLQADFRNQLKSECRRRSAALNTTIFGTAFSPSSSSSSSDDSYLVGVSSSGHILIWNLQQRDSSGSGSGSGNERTCIGDGPGKKRKIMEDNVNRNSPCFQFKVCDGALYDVQFISNSDDTGNGSLLVACGENGIFLYAFEDIISSMKKGLISSSLLPPKCKSYMTLTPNLPSTGSAFTPEFNRISYDKSSGNLYGAAGDGRGYIWDINTSQLVGSLSSSGKSDTNAARSSSGSRSRRSHLNSDYLHTIKVIDADSNAPCHGCVLTGGEGNFSMWSGKDQKLIDTFDCRAMGVDAVTSSSSSSSSHGATAAAISKKKCWVSSIAVDTVGNWCMIGGGRKGSSSSTASTSASTSATRDGGYLQLFSIQNRTMMNSSSSFMYRETPEIIHDIAYDASGSNILSVGDNGIVSSWESMNLGKGRTGKAWGSSPASYSVSVHREDGMVVTGNVRSSVDCFTEYLAKTCTLTVA